MIKPWLQQYYQYPIFPQSIEILDIFDKTILYKTAELRLKKITLHQQDNHSNWFTVDISNSTVQAL